MEGKETIAFEKIQVPKSRIVKRHYIWQGYIFSHFSLRLAPQCSPMLQLHNSLLPTQDQLL